MTTGKVQNKVSGISNTALSSNTFEEEWQKWRIQIRMVTSGNKIFGTLLLYFNVPGFFLLRGL
jgi:hypothetical protein